MRGIRWIAPAAFVILAGAWIARGATDKLDTNRLVTGQAAFVDYRTMKTGTFRKITVADLPQPYATESARNSARIVPRPVDGWPQAPAGFKVELYASGLQGPRTIRQAPNGDLFVAETRAGNVKVFRGRTADGKPEQVSLYASGLRQPYGIAFLPAGSNPQWLYIGNTNAVVRFPYKSGDVKATAEPATIVPDLPTGGHSTRDVAFSQDGKRMWVAVGSLSNVDDPDENKAEIHRANILEYTPDGKFVKVYASGIRNPAGLGVNPATGELWCSTNERDALGDNLVPDLLVSPHNASLGLTFYTAQQFPDEFRGDLFAAEHGSWNRSSRTGYEVIRVPLQNGHATGEFQDFLTGFMTANGEVWGRPVGVAVGPDGALFVTDDGSHSIWRVSYGK
jgi:glucose/arabinose dehydrogenase